MIAPIIFTIFNPILFQNSPSVKSLKSEFSLFPLLEFSSPVVDSCLVPVRK